MNVGLFVILAILLLLNVLVSTLYFRFCFLSNHKVLRMFGPKLPGKNSDEDNLNIPFLNEDSFLPLFIVMLVAEIVVGSMAFQGCLSPWLQALVIFFAIAFTVACPALIIIVHNNSAENPTNYIPYYFRALLASSYRNLMRLMPANVRRFSLAETKEERRSKGEQSKEERQNSMLQGIIQFGNEMVKDIMTVRLDVVDLDIRMPFSQVLNVISENNYSRIPVFSGSKDNIVGILYVKDLLPYLGKPGNFRWASLIRPHLCVPETKKIDNLLKEFQSKKIHLAVVIDEYGGVSGIVTLEDIIEEIVGEINDEYDDGRLPYVKIAAQTYIIDAKTSLQTVCKLFNLPDMTFDEVGEEADTLAGLLLELVGDIPEKHQHISFRQFDFEVLEMDERHIEKVKLTYRPEQK